mmetsp:Transcript_17880/g.18646  ORF Transcript_17880/g.18646 Transcript_17880/m.18646 type:complete len:511 (+) Transcript_17880:59-1591(+)
MEEIIHSNYLIRILEVYENERYQLSAMGWSSQGLLPTDRKNFSSKDGKIGWNNIEQSSQSLISRGWLWLDNNWNINKEENVTDNDGWMYATNFGSIDQSSAIKTMSHFVRRRRYTRKQILILYPVIGGTCDNCDLQEVQHLSAKLLDVLTEASLSENSGAIPSDIVTNSLKDELLTFLGFGQVIQTSESSITLDPFTIPSDLTIDLDPTLDITIVKSRLEKGAFLGYLQSKKSAWSKAASIFSSENTEKFPLRAVQLDNSIFTGSERKIISESLIRAYDKKFEFHCDKINCQNECIFSRHQCSHDGCTAIYSLKWKDQHDAICPYIIIPCPRDCGVQTARRLMNVHLTDECKNRPAECPYHAFGCNVTELTVGSLEQHVLDSVHAHLLLVTTRVTEQQQVIVRLHKKLAECEENNSKTNSTVSTIQTSLAALVVSVRAVERVADDKKPIENVEKKLEREISNVAREVSNVKSSIQNLERATNTLNTKVTAVESRLPQPNPQQQQNPQRRA